MRLKTDEDPPIGIMDVSEDGCMDGWTDVLMCGWVEGEAEDGAGNGGERRCK